VQQFRALRRANDRVRRHEGADSRDEAADRGGHKASHAAMLAILTPDQQDQLKAARQSHSFGRRQDRAFRSQGRSLRGDPSQDST